MKKLSFIMMLLSIFTFFLIFNYGIKAAEEHDIKKAFDVSDTSRLEGQTLTLTQDEETGIARGVATLKNKVDFSKGFELNGKINIGNIDYKNNQQDLGDGLVFGFSNENTRSIGRAGGGLGISGLKGAFGWKLDTYFNTTSDNGGSNDDEIKSNQFYASDPIYSIIDPDYLYTPGSIYGGFISNDYNNDINTTHTYTTANGSYYPIMDNKSEEYLSNPKNISRVIKKSSDGWLNIKISYHDDCLYITLGEDTEPQWKINLNSLYDDFSNEQPKSFFIAGSNGVNTGTQKFDFSSVSYTPYPTVNLNFKDTDENYIYNNQVNGANEVIRDGKSTDNYLRYSSEVNYNRSNNSYNFSLPKSILGYEFKKLIHDKSVSSPKLISENDDSIRYEGKLQGNLNNGNIDAIYSPNHVTFKYVDEHGNPIPNENDVEKTFVTAKDGKSYYTNFENNYFNDESVNKKISGYTLQDGQTNNFNVDFRSNRVVNLKYKKLAPEIKQGTVTVIYQDEHGKSIKSNLSMQGDINSEYKIDTPEISGYKFKSVESNKPLSGKYTDNETTVVLNYEKISDEPTPVNPVPTPPLSKGTLTVHYLDEYGKEFNKKFTSGNVGDSYSVATPNDRNYQFTSVSKGNLNGNYIDGNIDVYLNYKLIKNDNNSNYDNNGLLKKDTIVYPTKSMNLYKSNRFSKTNLLRHYTNKPMVNKPIFVVDGYGKSKTGLLRYKVHEMNHKNRVGYITVRKDYVLPVYETNFNGKVTVISAGGINEYSKKNLTRKLIHYKQGQTLDVKGIAWNKRSTRYVLNNGTFITANKTLVSKGVQKQVKSFTAKKGLTIYNDVQLSKKVKTVKKTKTMLIKNWDYSDKDNILKHGSLRYRVSGGYVYAGSKYVKNVK